MAITHYVKIKPNMGQNYYVRRYRITTDAFTGVDEQTASYLRKKEQFEVITKNQYNKLNGIEEPKEDKQDVDTDEFNPEKE